ncbi:hypothetical protein Tco_1430620 [Tanacetum coccineum]
MSSSNETINLRSYPISSISSIVDNYLASKLKDAMDVAVHLQSNKLREEAQAENEEFLSQVDSNIKAIIKDQVRRSEESLQYDQDKDEDPFAGSNRGSKRMRSGKEAESSKELTHKEFKSTSSSKGASRSQPKSSGKSSQAEEHGQKIDDLEEQSHQEFNTGKKKANSM